MKHRLLWLIAIILIAFSVLNINTSFAQDATATPSGTSDYNKFKNFDVTLLDFSSYEERNKEVYPLEKNPNLEYLSGTGTAVESQPVNQPLTGTNFNKDGDPLYDITQYDMKIQNWVVDLNSSADNIINRYFSYCKKITLGKEPELDDAGQIKKDEKGETVLKDSERKPIVYEENQPNPELALGARIHFPEHNNNAHAVIHPLFEIATYNTIGHIINMGNGVMDNVGRIRQVVCDVAGRKFPHSVSVRLKDQLGNITEYFLGYLNYNNWKKLKWDNPYYFPEVDHPTHLFQVPLYPRERPHIKFDSFVVRRFGEHIGGDFIVYFKKIKMSFDFAIPPEDSTDVNDEAYWGILKAIHDKRRRHQLKQARDIIEKLREETARKGQNLILGDHPIRFK